MFDREWTLNHADDHALIQTRIDVPMGGIHRDQHGLSSFDGLMLGPNDDNPFTFQTKDAGYSAVLVRSSKCCNGAYSFAIPVSE